MIRRPFPLAQVLVVSLFSMFLALGASAQTLPSGPFDVPALIRLLKQQKHAKIRRYAARKLKAMGTKAAPAIPALIKALQDANVFVRIEVRRALGAIGPKAIPALRPLLKSSSSKVRLGAVESLVEMGQKAAPTLGAMIILLAKDPSGDVRKASARVIGNIGPGASAAVPTLIFRLKDKVLAVRSFSVVALGKIGPGASPATAALLKAFQNPAEHNLVLGYIAKAFGQIGPKASAAIPALIKALKRKHMASEAATSLGQMGARASAAVAALLGLLKRYPSDADWGIRHSVYGALGKIGPKARRAIPALRLASQREKRSYVRKRAAKALALIQKKAR